MELSLANELLYFGEDGRLYIAHECEMCEKFPLEDLNSECGECGYSQAELLELKRNVDRLNEAYDFFNIYENDENSFSKGAYLEVSAMKLGDGIDGIELQDTMGTGVLRGMADLVDKDCYVIFYYDKDEEYDELDSYLLFFDEDEGEED